MKHYLHLIRVCWGCNMNAFEISDVSSYVKYVFDIGKEKLTSKNSQLLFRGQSDKNYEIIPSIARNYNGKSAPLLCHEKEMVETAKAQLPNIFKTEYEPIELLALLQHHGIPTRLLDVTENALVGLYFACLGDNESDGEVFLFEQNKDNVRVNCLANAIADSYRFADGGFTYLDTFYQGILNQVYFFDEKHILEKAHTEPQDGANWIKNYAVSPIFATSQIHSLRQQAQAGKYILFANEIGCERGGDVFYREIAPMSKEHECIVGRIIVLGSLKEKILKELTLLGISRRTLFPDNIDVVCDEIKKFFL